MGIFAGENFTVSRQNGFPHGMAAPVVPEREARCDHFE